MNAAIVIALAVAVPIILLPVALVWYINLGGMFAALKEARERRALTERAEAVDSEIGLRTGEDTDCPGVGRGSGPRPTPRFMRELLGLIW